MLVTRTRKEGLSFVFPFGAHSGCFSLSTAAVLVAVLGVVGFMRWRMRRMRIRQYSVIGGVAE